MNITNYQYFIEYRKSDEPDVWNRQSESCAYLNYAQHLVNNYLERAKSGCPPYHDGSYPLEYRIVEVKTETTENIIQSNIVEYPESDLDNSDELHYLKQTYKYLKHLEYTYKVRLKNVKRAWDINSSILHIEKRIEEIEKKETVDKFKPFNLNLL
jgi:hypothetical protein